MEAEKDPNAVETVVGEIQDRVTAAGEAAKAVVGVAVPIPGDILQEVTDVVNAQEAIVGETTGDVIDYVTSYANKLLALVPKIAKVATG